MTESAPGLKRARQSVGLDPDKLSEVTGVGAEQIRNLEAGGTESAAVVEALQGFFARKYGHDVRTPSA